MRWGQSRFDPPLRAVLSAPHGLPLDVILFTQFVQEIIEGEAREEVCSRVNDLVFISTALICGENLQVRQSMVRFKDPEGVLGLEMSRARESLA